MMISGIGGAVTPVSMLPGWAQAIAPATPAYWAMKGFTKVSIEGGSIADVFGPVSVLCGFSLVFVVIAAMRFRTEDAKVGWA